MLSFIRSSLILLATMLLTGACSAHSFRFETNDLRKVSPGDLFSSIDGRFTIGLPKQFSGYHPNVADTPNGKVETTTFDWRTAYGVFAVGYFDRPEPLESQSTKLLNGLRDTIVRGYGDSGKFTGESELALDGHSGRQLNFELADGGVTTLRLFLVKNRIYQTIATLTSADKSKLPAALKTLDTFRLLTEEQTADLLNKMIEQATPPPLPQSPAVKRATTDAADQGLKGKVKTVTTESAQFNESRVPRNRKQDSFDTYDESGNFVKRMTHNGSTS